LTLAAGQDILGVVIMRNESKALHGSKGSTAPFALACVCSAARRYGGSRSTESCRRTRESCRNSGVRCSRWPPALCRSRCATLARCVATNPCVVACAVTAPRIPRRWTHRCVDQRRPEWPRSIGVAPRNWRTSKVGAARYSGVDRQRVARRRRVAGLAQLCQRRRLVYRFRARPPPGS